MIRILLASERRSDWKLIESFLREVNRRYEVQWAPSYAEAATALGRAECQLCIVDADLGRDRGLELVSALADAGLRAPIIVLSETDDPRYETTAIRSGAAAVLVREDLTAKVLERAVRHALDRARSFDPSGVSGMSYSILSQAELLDRIEFAQVRARRSHAGCAVLAVSYDMATSARATAEHVGAAFHGPLVERIRDCIGPTDSVFRTERHELGVVLELLHDVRSAAEVAGRVLSAMSEPITLQGKEIQLAGQVGIAIFPEHGSQPETLVQLAREAMHSARSGSRSQLRVHGSVRPGAPSAGSRRSELRRALPGADERGELSLHYQPQVDVVDHSLVGAEALMRWTSPELGQVPPAEFVPLAEELGLITGFGAWALREACKQGKIWADAGRPLRVGVNVSAQQFHMQGRKLGDVVRQALDESGLPANLLELEITEGLLLENTNTTRELLAELRREGVLIAVDDFGTGYASLSYVKRFPMDVIKIDREFVRNLPVDAENAAITSSIVALAHCLGIEVIAEGVETEAEEVFLRALGCRIVQGYLHGRPMPAEDFTLWYEGRRASGVDLKRATSTSASRPAAVRR